MRSILPSLKSTITVPYSIIVPYTKSMNPNRRKRVVMQIFPFRG